MQLKLLAVKVDGLMYSSTVQKWVRNSTGEVFQG